jgi:hypothetical protein
MNKFKMTNTITKTVREFDEETAPSYLKLGGRIGSTMDMRWFWNNHVMTLKVGETVATDFNIIERIE